MTPATPVDPQARVPAAAVNWADRAPSLVESTRELLAAAEAAGWGAKHRATWQHVESGHNKNPKVSTMEGIALAFGCTVSDLLTSPPRRAGKRRKGT